jgi:hypothetical protein
LSTAVAIDFDAIRLADDGRRMADGRFPRGTSIEIRLFSRVEVTAAGCWEFHSFTDYRDDKGYGQISYQGRMQKAHRVSWKITRGDPGDLCVLHHWSLRSQGTTLTVIAARFNIHPATASRICRGEWR